MGSENRCPGPLRSALDPCLGATTYRALRACAASPRGSLSLRTQIRFFIAAQPAWLEYAWRVCANLGMTTFFVLSGFVIHYNYGANIAAKGAPAIRSFLIARFARLYPLYLLVLLISIALCPSLPASPLANVVLAVSDDDAGMDADVARRQIARYALCRRRVVDQRRGRPLHLLFGARRSARWTADCSLNARVVAGLSIVGTIFIGGYASGFWLGRLPHQDWWLSLSPFCRVPEFLLGALIAQLYQSAPICGTRDGRGSWEAAGSSPRLRLAMSFRTSKLPSASRRALPP